MNMECCRMRGFLTYLILWNLGKRSMSGAELASELKKRKGATPSPGTIYPALKELRKQGLIAADRNKSYTLTKKGKDELKSACCSFCGIFYDMNEMLHFCK